MAYFLGIDPGLAGAITLLKDKTVLAVENLPFRKPERSLSYLGKSPWFYKKELDAEELQKIIKKYFRKIDFKDALIEDVTMIKKTSKKSLLTIGKNYGAILAIFDLEGISLSPVTPAGWKNKMNVTANKRTSIDKCDLLFGTSECERFGLDTDHNRAESALIAYSGTFKDRE